MRHHQLEPAVDDRGAVLGCARAPRRPCAIGGLDGAPRLVGAHLGDRTESFAIRRILDRNGAAAIGIDPGAVDITLLTEKLRIGEFHGDVLRVGLPCMGSGDHTGGGSIC